MQCFIPAAPWCRPDHSWPYNKNSSSFILWSYILFSVRELHKLNSYTSIFFFNFRGRLKKNTLHWHIQPQKSAQLCMSGYMTLNTNMDMDLSINMNINVNMSVKCLQGRLSFFKHYILSTILFHNKHKQVCHLKRNFVNIGNIFKNLYHCSKNRQMIDSSKRFVVCQKGWIR